MGSRHAWSKARLQSFPPVHEIAVIDAEVLMDCCSTILLSVVDGCTADEVLE